MAGDSEEKNLPPSAKRLRDLKRKGNIPFSRDLPATARLIAVVAYLIMGGSYLGQHLLNLMSIPQYHVRTDYTTQLQYSVQLAISSATSIIFPLLGLAAAAAIFTTLMDMRGLHISEKAGKIDFTKLNPVSGIKQIFTKRNLFDLIKAFVLMIMMVSAVWIIIRMYLNDLLWAPTCGLNCVLNASVHVLLIIIVVGIALILLFALADIPLSRMLFTSENKMSVSEQKREQKEEHGSPEIRRERRSQRNALLESSGNVGIGKANLLLVSEEGALGIRYVRGETPAPIVVAKGHKEMLGAFIETVEENNGVIYYPEPDMLAELMKKSPKGEFIPKVFFDQVANILIKTGLVS